MSINFRLPSWPVNISIYTKSPGVFGQTHVADIDVQIYTALRNPIGAVVEGNFDLGISLYMMSKKEDFASVLDLYDHSILNDGLISCFLLTYPTAEDHQLLMEILDTAPRWLGFDNEHMISHITKAPKQDYLQFITNGTTASNTESVPNVISDTGVAGDPGSGGSPIVIEIVIKDASGNVLPYRSATLAGLSFAGNLTYQPSQLQTSGIDGKIRWEIYDDTAEGPSTAEIFIYNNLSDPPVTVGPFGSFSFT